MKKFTLPPGSIFPAHDSTPKATKYVIMTVGGWRPLTDEAKLNLEEYVMGKPPTGLEMAVERLGKHETKTR